MTLSPPTNTDTWIGLDNQTLPVNEALEWVNQPDCGAVVPFTGNIRNHAEGRANVTEVTYESYEEQALPRLEKIAEKTVSLTQILVFACVATDHSVKR